MIKFIEKLTLNLGLLLTFNRASRVSTLLLVKLKYLIRVTKTEALFEGHDEDFDKTVHVVAVRLLYPEIFERDNNFFSIKAQYAEIKTDVDSIVREMIENQTVIQTLSDYFLSRHFVEQGRKKESIAQYNLARAMRLGLKDAPLTVGDLDSLDRTLRKDVGKLRDILADRGAWKIDVSFEKIAFLIPVVSSLFLISGYLHNYLLLGEFGVDVSYFFTLADYFASSVSSIGYSLVAVSASMIGVFWEIFSLPRESMVQVRYELNCMGIFL